MARRREERFDTTLALTFEEGEGLVRNVSAGGIYFTTDVALDEGAPLRFRLEFQDLPGGPVAVTCIGRIVRVEVQGEKKGVAAAIQSFEFYRVAPKKH